MEPLADQQTSNGREIQRIITNYKKDPKDRKSSKAYYEERLVNLEAAWSRFEATDNEIRLLPDPPIDHPYFSQDYYQAMKKVYSEYRGHFLEKIRSLTHSEEHHYATVNPPSDPDEDEATAHHLTSVSKFKAQGACPKIATKRQELPGSIQPPVNSEASDLLRIMKRQKSVAESLRRLIDGIQGETEQPRQYYELKLNTNLSFHKTR